MTDDEIKQKLERIDAKVEQLLRQQAELHAKLREGLVDISRFTGVALIAFLLVMIYLIFVRSC